MNWRHLTGVIFRRPQAGNPSSPVAPWELRIGKLRVYYDIGNEPAKVVSILAIGIKDRNRVRSVMRTLSNEDRRKGEGNCRSHGTLTA